MANKLRVIKVEIAHQIECHHYRGCDGYPAATVFSPVGVTTEDGRKFYLPMGQEHQTEEGVCYTARYDASSMADKVHQVRLIDPDYWIEVSEVDLEEEWGPEAAYRERHDEESGLGWY